jgi:hypothetical protein
MKRCTKILLSIIVIVWAVGPNLSNIQAAEYRHQKAHEHGVAQMNVAFEGNELYIELISPAANIVGFEHQPRTQDQKAAVKAAIKKLEAGEKIFSFPSAAGGSLVKSKVHTDINNDYSHESDEAKSHEHDETSTDAGHETEKHGHEEHQHGDEHERHSEFKAEYHFVCKKPEKLVYVDVMLFSVFSGIEHIEVQLLTGTKQTAYELTVTKKKILFKN